MELPLSYTDLNTRRLIEKQHSCQSSQKCCRATAALKSRRATPPKSPPLPTSPKLWTESVEENGTLGVRLMNLPHSSSSSSFPVFHCPSAPPTPTHRRADCAFPPQVVNLFSVSLFFSPPSRFVQKSLFWLMISRTQEVTSLFSYILCSPGVHSAPPPLNH